MPNLRAVWIPWTVEIISSLVGPCRLQSFRLLRPISDPNKKA